MNGLSECKNVALLQPISLTQQKWDDNTVELVSICCLTYNHEAYIKNTLEGFLMQETTFPVQIVIFDDCSTDNTIKIIKNYSDRYPNLFKLFLQPENTWGKPIRDTALGEFFAARKNAKYVAICEGDDYWIDSLKLQKQVEFLEANTEYSLICGGFKSVNVQTKEEEIIIKDIEHSSDNTDAGFDITLERFFRQWLTKTLTLVYRQELYNLNDFKNYKLKRDVHVNYHLLKQGKGYYMKEVLGVYHIHAGGIFSLKPTYSKKKISYLILKEIYENNTDDNYCRLAYFNSIRSIIKKRIYQSDKNLKKYRLIIELLLLVRNKKEMKKVINTIFERVK